MAWAGLNPAPPTLYNKPIGPHRRFTWVRANLTDIKDGANTGVMSTTKLTPDAAEVLTYEVKEGANKLALEITVK